MGINLRFHYPAPDGKGCLDPSARCWDYEDALLHRGTWKKRSMFSILQIGNRSSMCALSQDGQPCFSTEIKIRKGAFNLV